MPVVHSKAVALLPLLALAGCNILGAAAYKLAPEPEVPAEFSMAKVPTVVLVENFRHPDLAVTDAEFLAVRIEQRLKEKNVVPIVSSSRLVDLRGRSLTAYRKMTVKDIAKAVEAEQVIYVSFETGGFSQMAGSSVVQGKATVLVKIIDAATGDTLWPTTLNDGRAVNFETNPNDGGNTPNAQVLRGKLYDGLAARVARLFYKFKPSEVEESASNNGA